MSDAPVVAQLVFLAGQIVCLAVITTSLWTNKLPTPREYVLFFGALLIQIPAILS